MRRPTGPMLALAATALLGLSAPALAQTHPSQPDATRPGGGPQGPQTLQNNSGTRALDRAAGTNTSGAYPSQSDGTASNPPGTAATRALDRAAGTNTSGAYPRNEQAPNPAPNPAPNKDRRGDLRRGHILLAQGTPGASGPGETKGETLRGSNAQSGSANNSGMMPRTGTGNTASRPESQPSQPATPSTQTNNAPSVETREVPASANPDPAKSSHSR